MHIKVAFFQKVRFIFQIPQSPKKIIPKNYPELNLNKLFTDMGGNFKFQAQDSFFGIIFWGDLKSEFDFLKKRHL